MVPNYDKKCWKKSKNCKIRKKSKNFETPCKNLEKYGSFFKFRTSTEKSVILATLLHSSRHMFPLYAFKNAENDILWCMIGILVWWNIMTPNLIYETLCYFNFPNCDVGLFQLSRLWHWAISTFQIVTLGYFNFLIVTLGYFNFSNCDVGLFELFETFL